ncbi:LuxR C-terminal-related transcriptional regulator [Microbacterium mitrae]|uniref:GAF domain-containing protein n=1 Tax=Microbacterium mitrae TaxID=664640 RepID=A0A5C8HPX4_9MICO|nr:LuxR C-terminal-related transcriptional regulator [Microbacterium mitrae]TXK04844.1 GAF domain-containing protein [Microbacterium mitrae]
MPVTDDPQSDDDAVAKAVKSLAARTNFPVAFGGLIADGEVQVKHVIGARTKFLEELRVVPQRGLGGQAVAEQRPRMTADYRSNPRITHDYDRQILGEGIATLLAVPVVVNGEARGVLYGGAWDPASMSGVVAAPAFQVAEELATELRIRDEVRRRLSRTNHGAPTGTMTPAQREELRESYAELRSLSASITDQALRARLEGIERRLAGISGLAGQSTAAPATDIHLSPRETDVLACAALGATTAEIAAQLGLKQGTVKAYLGTAMGKLDASTRHAAVTKARLLGLLP